MQAARPGDLVMHITDLFFLDARNHPHRLAMSGDGGDFTYLETQSLSNRIARRLQTAGLGVGHKFAVLSPNTGPALIAILGGMRAGLAWCNLNMRAAIGDIVHILKAGSCHVVFMHSSAEPMMAEIRAAVPSLRDIICLDSVSAHGPALTVWLGDMTDAPLDLRPPAEALGVQGTTGGTTGRSKLTQSNNRFLPTITAGCSFYLQSGVPPINLAVAPITHAGGVIALSMGQLGGTTVMMAQPDVGRMIDLIVERQVSVLFLPPTLVYMMLTHPKLASADTTSLVRVLAGETPVPLRDLPGRIILHIIPLSAADPTPRYVGLERLRSSSEINAWFPWGATGYSMRRNFDGFVTYSGSEGPKTRAYVQVFRSGMIEVVATDIVQVRDTTRTVWVNNLATQFLTRVLAVLPALRQADVDPPYSVQLTMGGVRGTTFAVEDANAVLSVLERPFPVELDVLFFSDALLTQDDVTPSQVAYALKPTLDQLFQTAAYPGFPWLNADGSLRIQI
jgi:acyl-CoA synthetase (AMP-forming)/AMP-acid ligase II